MDKILIVFVTFNASKYLKESLSDIYSNKFDIIVIDNSSVDNTTRIIANEYPKIKLVKLKENIGFGQANNLALKYATKHDYDYILLLNQDTMISSETISELVEFSRSHEEYGILSPLHYFDKNNLQITFSNHIKKNPILIEDLSKNKFTKNIYDVPFVNAAIWLIKTDCIKNVGGFCPIFFHYGEDDNFCHRVLFHRYKIGIVPSLKAYHFSDNNYSHYFKNKPMEHFMIKEKLRLLNPLKKYNYNKRLIYFLLRILKNIFLLRKQSLFLIKFFIAFLRIDNKTILNIKEASKSRQPLFINE